MNNWINELLKFSSDTQVKIAATVAIVFVLWLTRQIISFVIWRKIEDAKSRYSWRKTSGYVLVVIGFLIIGRVWFTGFKSFATFLGIFSAGLAIALKDIILNPVAWTYLMWKKPFEVGDRVQIGGHSGDVLDISLSHFTLMEIGNWVDADQSTGRVIHIPNGKVLNADVANYHKGFQYIWNEIQVLITFESNWEKAKEILSEIAKERAEHLSKPAAKKVKEASKKLMIFYKNLTPIVYTSVKPSGVLLTIRYLCQPRQRRSTEQAIWEDVLHKFADNEDIELAYPTQRFFQG